MQWSGDGGCTWLGSKIDMMGSSGAATCSTDKATSTSEPFIVPNLHLSQYERINEIAINPTIIVILLILKKNYSQ